MGINSPNFQGEGNLVDPLLITLCITVTLCLICVVKVVLYGKDRVVKVCDRSLFLVSGILISFLLAWFLRHNLNKALPYLQESVESPQIAVSDAIRKV